MAIMVKTLAPEAGVRLHPTAVVAAARSAPRVSSRPQHALKPLTRNARLAAHAPRENFRLRLALLARTRCVGPAAHAVAARFNRVIALRFKIPSAHLALPGMVPSVRPATSRPAQTVEPAIISSSTNCPPPDANRARRVVQINIRPLLAHHTKTQDAQIATPAAMGSIRLKRVPRQRVNVQLVRSTTVTTV